MFEDEDYTDDELEAIGVGQWNRTGVVWDDPDLIDMDA